MENPPENNPGGQPQVLPAVPPDRKRKKNEKTPVSTGEGETSEDELPMVNVQEVQPTATTTKNGVVNLRNLLVILLKISKGPRKAAPRVLSPTRSS